MSELPSFRDSSSSTAAALQTRAGRLVARLRRSFSRHPATIPSDVDPRRHYRRRTGRRVLRLVALLIQSYTSSVLLFTGRPNLDSVVAYQRVAAECYRRSGGGRGRAAALMACEYYCVAFGRASGLPLALYAYTSGRTEGILS